MDSNSKDPLFAIRTFRPLHYFENMAPKGHLLGHV